MYAVMALISVAVLLWGATVWASFIDEEPYSPDSPSSGLDRDAA